jgi:hypothetical protein
MSSLEQDNYKLQNQLQDMKIKMEEPQQQQHDLLQTQLTTTTSTTNNKETMIDPEAGVFHIPLAEAVPSEDYKSYSRRCIVAGILFVLIALAAGGAVSGVIFVGHKTSSDEENSVGTSPDAPPTSAPTPAPAPTKEACSRNSNYLQIPFNFEDMGMNVNTIYSIGCGDNPDETQGGGYSEDIMALEFDDQNCVRCLGSLAATEYASVCLAGTTSGTTSKITFKLPALGDGDQVWVGFANPSATNTVNCAQSLTMV